MVDNHTAITDDGFNSSPIVHWDPIRYLAFGAHASNEQPSEIAEWNYGALSFTNQNKQRTPRWYALSNDNTADRLPIFGCLSSLTQVLSVSTVFDAGNISEDHYAPDNVTDAEGVPDADTNGQEMLYLWLENKNLIDSLLE